MTRDEIARDAAEWAARCALEAERIRAETVDIPEDTDDIEELRESFIRHRAAAAAERQAHEARAFVCDVFVDDKDGSGRIIVATPTGDRREERECLIQAVVAFELMRACAIQEYAQAQIVCFLLGWLLSDTGAP